MRGWRLLVLVGLTGLFYGAGALGMAWADEGALSTKVWGAIGTPVTVAVTIAHEALHVVQKVAGSVMTVTHAALNILNAPWNPSEG